MIKKIVEEEMQNNMDALKESYNLDEKGCGKDKEYITIYI